MELGAVFDNMNDNSNGTDYSSDCEENRSNMQHASELIDTGLQKEALVYESVPSHATQSTSNIVPSYSQIPYGHSQMLTNTASNASSSIPNNAYSTSQPPSYPPHSTPQNAALYNSLVPGPTSMPHGQEKPLNNQIHMQCNQNIQFWPQQANNYRPLPPSNVNTDTRVLQPICNDNR